MNVFVRIDNLKDYIADKLDPDDALAFQHDLNAVAKVIEKIKKDNKDFLTKVLSSYGWMAETLKWQHDENSKVSQYSKELIEALVVLKELKKHG